MKPEPELIGQQHENVICLQTTYQTCQAISIIRRRKWSDRWRAMQGAARRLSKVADLSMCSRASAWLPWITAVVLLGMDPRRRTGGVDQYRDRAPIRDLEIPEPLLWRGLERCVAAHRPRVDALPLWWRAALVYVFGRLERGVLWPPGHQAVRRRTAVRLPPLLPARLRQPTGIGPSKRALEGAENPDAVGRQRKHARCVPEQTARHALADL
jgi:hypothetical protein